jgi:hypothetical protein
VPVERLLLRIINTCIVSAKIVELLILKTCGMFVGFEVFTAVTMRNAVFCDVAPCGFIIDRRFGGTCRLNLS